jgi:hypothetical protein
VLKDVGCPRIYLSLEDPAYEDSVGCSLIHLIHIYFFEVGMVPEAAYVLY